MSMGGRFAVLVIAACVAGTTAACVPTGGGGGGGGGGTANPPVISGCQIMPSDNAWNEKVDTFPVLSNSSALVANISSTNHTTLHADFGGDGAYGIPYMVVPSTQPKVPINYTAYGDESDPGPFPIPSNAPVEGGSGSDGDRHVIVLQQGACHDYELSRAFWEGDHWNADAGVNWNLSTNALRTPGWTSADAAGLPILPGLAKFDEVASGKITHALRFTVPHSQKGYISPATHYASSSTNSDLPPMGLRLRLKANFDLSKFHGESLVILQALKTYGMIVADNGSSWFISGAVDTRWDDNDLNQLKTVPGSAFEALNTGTIQH
jgi:hypothetical protein